MKRTQEDKNIDYLESRYCYEQRQKVYIANEEINQVFDESDIPEFIEQWKAGIKFKEIKEYFGIDEWEFLMLTADLISKGKIKGKIVPFRKKG